MIGSEVLIRLSVNDLLSILRSGIPYQQSGSYLCICPCKLSNMAGGSCPLWILLSGRQPKINRSVDLVKPVT
jgi:hypothetical protein